MELETLWIPEDNFRDYIWGAGDKAALEDIDGFKRWVVTGKDGVRYIVRPKTKDD